MGIGDYLILAVLAQLFYLIREVTRLKTLLNGLKGRCPYLRGDISGET